MCRYQLDAGKPCPAYYRWRLQPCRSAVNIWLKDLGIVLDAAADIDFDAPITRTALDQYKATADMGLGGEDDAAVIKLYAEQNGIELPVPTS